MLCWLDHSGSQQFISWNYFLLVSFPVQGLPYWISRSATYAHYVG